MNTSQHQTKITLNDIIIIALMSAIVFVSTRFLSIPIPTPTGKTMIKLANAFCLLAGILFGGWRGGLAAGFGSMLFDLTDPVYAPEAWLTFIRFFLMGWMCGQIAWSGHARGLQPKRNLIANITASLFSTLLYLGKGTLILVLSGSSVTAALIGQTTKFISSMINIFIAVIVSTILSPIIRRALASTTLYQHIYK